MQAPPMIAGLYRYVRDGKVSDRWGTPDEIRLSLEVNPAQARRANRDVQRSSEVAVGRRCPDFFTPGRWLRRAT